MSLCHKSLSDGGGETVGVLTTDVFIHRHLPSVISLFMASYRRLHRGVVCRAGKKSQSDEVRFCKVFANTSEERLIWMALMVMLPRPFCSRAFVARSRRGVGRACARVCVCVCVCVCVRACMRASERARVCMCISGVVCAYLCVRERETDRQT